MLSLVSKFRKQFKIFDSVVELVAVSVVYVVGRWHGAVELLPDNNVFHSLALLDSTPDASITLGRDVSITTRSTARRSSFAHDSSSFNCEELIITSNPSSPSSRSRFELLAQ
jgi:hypothetical protein